MLFKSVVVALFSSALATFPAGFRNCGDSATDALDLEGVSMNPLTPAAGEVCHVRHDTADVMI